MSLLDERALEALIDARARTIAREEIERAGAGEYLTVNAAAKVASVHPATIRAWLRAGRLRRYTTGAQPRVKRAELEALLAGEGLAPAGPESPEDFARRIVPLPARPRR